MAVLVEPLEIPVRMMRRSSKVKWEKAFGFFIGVPTFPAAERQDKCKTKSNRDGSRNECRTKFHFSLSKVEINFSLHLMKKVIKKQNFSLTGKREYDMVNKVSERKCAGSCRRQQVPENRCKENRLPRMKSTRCLPSLSLGGEVFYSFSFGKESKRR